MNARFEAFMERMRESAELARIGFRQLSQHAKPELFFDSLVERGFFEAAENPAPVEDKENRGFFRIPFWPALSYLEKLAHRAKELPDEELGRRILQIVREVSLAARGDERSGGNYHTNRIFAEILGIVPLSLVGTEDIDLIPHWLSDPFDRSLTSEAISTGLLSKLVASDVQALRSDAIRVLGHCTLLTKSSRESSKAVGSRAYAGPMDAYWLRVLLHRHSKDLGVRLGAGAIELVRTRLRQIFDDDQGASFSSVVRPSIGEHEQNHSWESLANAFIESLRDALLIWLDAGSPEGMEIVADLLCSRHSIERRIALYLLRERWELLESRFVPAATHFTTDTFHEAYELLDERWQQFSDRQQELTLGAIAEESQKDARDEREALYYSLRWLRALKNRGIERVDQLFERAQQLEVEIESDHPSFALYHETRVGPGPSPFSRVELEAFADAGELFHRLNSVEAGDSWNGSPLDALVQELEDAIATRPASFTRMIPEFGNARLEFQYALLVGFARAWEARLERGVASNEVEAWRQLLELIQGRIATDAFWDATDSRCWKGDPEAVVRASMRVLEVGARDDEHSYPLDQLAVCLEILRGLLARLPVSEELADDPMFQALNSPRGVVIQALLNTSLRYCRVASDKEDHSRRWKEVQPIFDRELEKCTDANFEFSTLLSSRLPNVYYLDREWLENRGLRVFSEIHPQNRKSALDGLSYSKPTGLTYRSLRDGGVIQAALIDPPTTAQARERLVEHVGLAYLWGIEELFAGAFGYLLDQGSKDDVVALAHLFWSAERNGLEQAQRARVLSFVSRVLELWQDRPEGRTEVERSLSRLISYVQSIDAEAAVWLERVARSASRGLELHEFAKGLERLAVQNPREVLRIMQTLLDESEPDFDFEGHLVGTTRQLVSAGFRVESIRLLDRLRRIEAARTYFRELSGEKAPTPAQT